MSTQPDALQQAVAGIDSKLAAQDTALASLLSGVNGLNTEIQQLKAQIAAGSSTLSPADQAAFDALSKHADQVSSEITAIVPQS